MEKKFIQSVLFSATILIVYSTVSPPLSLSAGSSLSFDGTARVRKGIVTKVDLGAQKLVVDFDGASVFVLANASTTITSPNGTEAEFSFLRDGSSIYVFGYYDNETHSIGADKIVMRNRPITERKSLSRAEMKNVKEMEGSSAVLSELNLTAR